MCSSFAQYSALFNHIGYVLIGSTSLMHQSLPLLRYLNDELNVLLAMIPTGIFLLHKFESGHNVRLTKVSKIVGDCDLY